MVTKAESTAEDRSKRRERAHRILDAAAELVQRWGYKKTTIDDIARQAGVAKGTIYLHWKARDALFTALMQREYARVTRDVLQRMNADPEGVLLSHLVKHTMLATYANPLVVAILQGGIAVFDELARTQLETTLTRRRIDGFMRYLEVSRAKGLVRTDHSIIEQTIMTSASLSGFIMTEAAMAEMYQITREAHIDLMAETMRLLAETPPPHDAQAMAEVADIFTRAMQYAIEGIDPQVVDEE